MRDFWVTLAAIIALVIAARIFDGPIRRVLKAIINSKPVSRLVIRFYAKKADKLFPGPKRGPEKKAWVDAKTKRWRIVTCKGSDDLINNVVQIMQNKSGAYKDQIEDKAGAAVDELVGKITEGKDE